MARQLTAWDCIGLVPSTYYVRRVGGKTLYEEALYNDATSRTGTRVKLARIDTTRGFIREVSQWVDADTPVELVEADGVTVAQNPFELVGA
jgi:hypothetical protein